MMPEKAECAVGECASRFPYHEECGNTGMGCCAREMLMTARAHPEGVNFPMDLTPGGNPFVNALRQRWLVQVNGSLTRALTDPRP